MKTLDDFDFRVQTSVKREVIAHLAQLDFLAEARTSSSSGRPGTGKTHLSIALAVQAARRGHRVAFATAQQWVDRLAAAKRAGRLDEELERLGRFPLLVVDEVGYIPFDPEAAALVLRAHQLPLRALLDHRQLEQDLLRLGRDLRRPGGGRGPRRPTRPPR